MNNPPPTATISAQAIQPLLREIAEFIALYETIEDKLIRRSNDIKERIQAAEQQLTQQLSQIQTTLINFQSIMTEAGAARWRLTANNAKLEAEAYLQALHKTCTEIHSSFNNGSEQLKQTANHALTSLSELAHLFPIADFKQVTEKNYTQIKTATTAAIQQITSLAKTFYRKNLIMIVALTLFIVFILGLYLNDEWPWEIHQQVIKERVAGQTLLAAWPQLPTTEQQDILNAAKKNINPPQSFS